MAFFKKDLEEPQPEIKPTVGKVRSPTPSPAGTYIGPGSHIEGNLTGDAEVVMDGSLKGSVALKSRLVLGKRGIIHANIVAQSVQIAGQIKGDIQAADKVEVTSTGSVEGNLSAPLVAISEGGRCNGRIEMKGALAIDATSDRKLVRSQNDPASS